MINSTLQIAFFCLIVLNPKLQMFCPLSEDTVWVRVMIAKTKRNTRSDSVWPYKSGCCVPAGQ